MSPVAAHPRLIRCLRHRCRAGRPGRRRGGFTLLELLVVAMVGMIVITFISNTWRWYSHEVNDLQVSAHLSRELKLAADAIAQDFGPSLAARTPDGSSVQFDYDSNADDAAQWEAPDLVIEYVRQDHKLIRRNLTSGSELAMAIDITEFTAEVVDGHLNVHLVAGYRDFQQDVTLQLQEP